MRPRLKVTIGASTKSMRLAPAGTMVSLNRHLIPSATGCNRPKGPTTLGPLRSWIAAHTLRSKYVMKASTSISGTTIARMYPMVRNSG